MKKGLEMWLYQFLVESMVTEMLEFILTHNFMADLQGG